MKCYISFVVRDGKFEIMGQKGVSKKVAEFNLRNNGFKIKRTFSKNVYEEYQQKEPCIFFEKYGSYFTLKESRKILNKMYGK